MKIKIFSILAIIVSGVALLAAPVLYAHGYNAEKEQVGMQEQQKIQQSIEPKVKSTGEQQNLFHTCMAQAGELHAMARSMRETSYQPDFKIEDTRKQFAQLQVRMQKLNEQDALFVKSLDDNQKTQLQSPLDAIDASQNLLKSTMKSLEKEYEKIEPDRKQIFHCSEEIERALQDWIVGYREIEISMGLEPM